MTAGTKYEMGFLSTQQIAKKRFVAAKNITLFSISTSLLACSLTALPWWAFLPLVAAQLELFARVYDLGILGKVKRFPSPKSAFEKPTAVYTWEELAQHGTEQSAWIAINGFVYDITQFIDRHPGGKEILLLCTGRDATDLFNSYHPFTKLPRQVLAKYRIGSLSSYEHPVYKPDSGFYTEAADAVKKYFEQTGKNSKDPIGMIQRMVPVYVTFVLAYVLVYAVPNLSFGTRFGLAVVLGVCQGMPLTGWMHDASHTAIGNSERWWWNVGRFALDYVSGSSMLSWRNQHVIGHHVYTNVMGADPDLPNTLEGDPRRLVHEQVFASIYRWQHLYLPPLYGLLALKSRIQDVIEIFSKHTNGPIRVNPISTQDHLRMVSSKCVWAFYRIIVPFVFLPVISSVTNFLPLFFATEFTTGYWLAFNFQVSHVSDDCEFLFSDHSKRADGKCPAVVEDEWALSQIRTTMDYGHGDPVATYFSGALNYQTIHHLFPSVSQCHYPEITPIVMQIAQKHGVKFNVFNNFPTAFYAHWRHLRDLSREGKPAELKLE